ncbi:MAG: HAD-IIA family hydrolase [Clostridia bacterium]|nr:HAD-IIA family hydrolase [Clostridia bacterium]
MLKNKRLFLFDIDGTIAVDSTLYDGSFEMMNFINSIGGKAVYVTNNSAKSVSDYIKKFARWNIKTDESSFMTASTAACRYLKENFGNDKIFACATRSFVDEMKNFGLNVTEKDEENIKCVIVGFDNELTYEKAALTCKVLQTRDVEYVATNPDLCCPVGFGAVPDCGAICRMIECAVGRTPYFVGKPNRAIVDECVKNTGFSYDETIVVGDRLYTDIACGINAGVETAVVFTGECKKKDLKKTEYPPTYAFENIREFFEAIKNG